MPISATEILLFVVGGVALLLWGARMVRTGVTRAYGGSLRRALAAGTRNRFSAFGVGLGVTALLQSSTATALMVTSFASRDLIATAPALAIMLGADVGTSLVAQVLSLDLTWLSPMLILVGVVAFSSSKVTRRRDLGRVAIGLGLMLLALSQIVTVSAPIRDSAVVGELVAGLAGEPVIALLVGVLLTWLAHSSLAMVLLVISLASSGIVPLNLAMVLVLGANLGSAIPAIVATLGEPPRARRVPLGNLIFRLVGVLAVLPVIDLVVPYLERLEPAAARQVADFHTAFNLALAVFFIGLTRTVAALCARLLPGARISEDPRRARYLDPGVIDNPSLALTAAARETLRMGDFVETMFEKSLTVFRDDDRKLMAEVEHMDDTIDSLDEQIKLYLTDVSRHPLGDAESRRCVDIITFTTNLEHVGDIIDKNLMELAAKKIRKKISFSDAGLAEITRLHRSVAESLRLALSLFMSQEIDLARRLVAEKVTVRNMVQALSENHFDRLREGQAETIESSSLHLDVLRDLKRIHSHLSSVAYPILEEAGELRSTRLRTLHEEQTSVSPGATKTPPGVQP